MIIDKQPLPDDPTPADAPPSYDAPSAPYPRDDKATLAHTYPPPPTSAPAPPPPSPPPSPLQDPKRRSQQLSPKPKSKSWFSFSSSSSSSSSFSSSSRTAREVHSTILGLVRDLVRIGEIPSSPSAAKGILDSCLEASTTHGLNFSDILQEKSIEGHTPIYWAIIKRPAEPITPAAEEEEFDGPDLVTSLLHLSSPLSQSTISEIRLACLVTSDQSLFQRLRLSPAFSPVKGTDQMLLGESVLPPDSIEVIEVRGDEGAFVVELEIGMFQKRMRVGGGVGVEFIARGRLWSLSFSIATPPSCSVEQVSHKPGSWIITLALLEHSPPTWIDSRLIIPEPPPTSRNSSFTSTSHSPTHAPSSSSSSSSSPSPTTQKPKPTITLRLKSGSSELVAPPPAELDTRKKWQKEIDAKREKIVVALEDSLMGGSLQYAGSSYIHSDGTLKARLEARLSKPEVECVIC